MHYISSFFINTQSNYICKIPFSKTKSHKLSLQKCKSPLALWPPRGVTSTELKRPHISDRLPSLASFRFWEDGDAELELFWNPVPDVGLDFSFIKDPRISADVSLSSSSLSTWEETPITIESEHLWSSSLFKPGRTWSQVQTLKPSRLSSEIASGHSSMTKAMQVSYI